MITDPNHIKASDPGRVEGNVVFTYLDAFDEDHIAVEDLKARYISGGLGDTIVKKRLDDVLQALLAPIRDRRRALAHDPGYVLQVVKRGTARAREITDATLRDVRAALGLFTLD
jgi:tryptophanyl-tRNA synthetase